MRYFDTSQKCHTEGSALTCCLKIPNVNDKGSMEFSWNHWQQCHLRKIIGIIWVSGFWSSYDLYADQWIFLPIHQACQGQWCSDFSFKYKILESSYPCWKENIFWCLYPDQIFYLVLGATLQTGPCTQHNDVVSGWKCHEKMTLTHYNWLF